VRTKDEEVGLGGMTKRGGRMAGKERKERGKITNFEWSICLSVRGGEVERS
jgi:hypothetical protein